MESGILCLSGNELTVLVITIAIYLGEIFDVDDLVTIANFSNMLGDNLNLIAAQKVRCEAAKAEIVK